MRKEFLQRNLLFAIALVALIFAFITGLNQRQDNLINVLGTNTPRVVNVFNTATALNGIQPTGTSTFTPISSPTVINLGLIEGYRAQIPTP